MNEETTIIKHLKRLCNIYNNWNRFKKICKIWAMSNIFMVNNLKEHFSKLIFNIYQPFELRIKGNNYTVLPYVYLNVSYKMLNEKEIESVNELKNLSDNIMIKFRGTNGLITYKRFKYDYLIEKFIIKKRLIKMLFDFMIIYCTNNETNNSSTLMYYLRITSENRLNECNKNIRMSSSPLDIDIFLKQRTLILTILDSIYEYDLYKSYIIDGIYTRPLLNNEYNETFLLNYKKQLLKPTININMYNKIDIE